MKDLQKPICNQLTAKKKPTLNETNIITKVLAMQCEARWENDKKIIIKKSKFINRTNRRRYKKVPFYKLAVLYYRKKAHKLSGFDGVCF
jgi:hypothetical protein